VNCVLTAAVSVRAGSQIVPSWSAALTGLIAALGYLLLSQFCRRLEPRDRLDVVSVHGVGGVLGVVAVSLFRMDEQGIFYSLTTKSAHILGWNLIMCLVVVVYASVASLLIVLPSKKLGLLSQSQDDASPVDQAETKPLKSPIAGLESS